MPPEFVGPADLADYEYVSCGCLDCEVSDLEIGFDGSVLLRIRPEDVAPFLIHLLPQVNASRGIGGSSREDANWAYDFKTASEAESFVGSVAKEEFFLSFEERDKIRLTLLSPEERWRIGFTDQRILNETA
jgi:hypothetical protein